MSPKTILAAAVSASLVLAGCATSSKDVATAYVSPLQYQNHDCDQLRMEAQRVQVRVNQIGGRLDEAASNDKAIMGVGMILFWPALFALGGTKQQEAEYARLKGEYEAILQAATARKCDIEKPAPMMASAASAPPPSASDASPPTAAPVSGQQAAAAPMSAAQPAQVSTPSQGQDAFNAEALARAESCSATPRAALVAKGPGYETYSVACTSGEALMIRCELGGCRALK